MKEVTNYNKLYIIHNGISHKNTKEISKSQQFLNKFEKFKNVSIEKWKSFKWETEVVAVQITK